MGDRRDVLLKEYETCQSHMNTLGTQNWQSVSIFLLVNAIILGFVVSMSTHNKGSFATVFIIGVAVILVFCIWRKWVKRQEFVQKTLYARMREIETDLGMWKNWYAFLPDELDSDEKVDETTLPKEKKKIIKELRKLYSKPGGYKGLKCIAVIIMASWLFLMLREAILGFKIPLLYPWFIN